MIPGPFPHLQLSAEWTSIHPYFEASAGFLRRKDVRALSTRGAYPFIPQNADLISAIPSLSFRRTHSWITRPEGRRP